jgi:hypothetical protein
VAEWEARGHHRIAPPPIGQGLANHHYHYLRPGRDSKSSSRALAIIAEDGAVEGLGEGGVGQTTAKGLDGGGRHRAGSEHEGSVRDACDTERGCMCKHTEEVDTSCSFDMTNTVWPMQAKRHSATACRS